MQNVASVESIAGGFFPPSHVIHFGCEGLLARGLHLTLPAIWNSTLISSYRTAPMGAATFPFKPTGMPSSAPFCIPSQTTPCNIYSRNRSEKSKCPSQDIPRANAAVMACMYDGHYSATRSIKLNDGGGEIRWWWEEDSRCPTLPSTLEVDTGFSLRPIPLRKKYKSQSRTIVKKKERKRKRKKKILSGSLPVKITPAPALLQFRMARIPILLTVWRLAP